MFLTSLYKLFRWRYTNVINAFYYVGKGWLLCIWNLSVGVIDSSLWKLALIVMSCCANRTYRFCLFVSFSIHISLPCSQCIDTLIQVTNRMCSLHQCLCHLHPSLPYLFLDIKKLWINHDILATQNQRFRCLLF